MRKTQCKQEDPVEKRGTKSERKAEDKVQSVVPSWSWINPLLPPNLRNLGPSSWVIGPPPHHFHPIPTVGSLTYISQPI